MVRNNLIELLKGANSCHASDLPICFHSRQTTLAQSSAAARCTNFRSSAGAASEAGRALPIVAFAINCIRYEDYSSSVATVRTLELLVMLKLGN